MILFESTSGHQIDFRHWCTHRESINLSSSWQSWLDSCTVSTSELLIICTFCLKLTLNECLQWRCNLRIQQWGWMICLRSFQVTYSTWLTWSMLHVVPIFRFNECFLHLNTTSIALKHRGRSESRFRLRPDRCSKFIGWLLINEQLLMININSFLVFYALVFCINHIFFLLLFLSFNILSNFLCHRHNFGLNIVLQSKQSAYGLLLIFSTHWQGCPRVWLHFQAHEVFPLHSAYKTMHWYTSNCRPIGWAMGDQVLIPNYVSFFKSE